MIIPERLNQLDTLTLDNSAHASFGAGHCAMELAAWLAGEPHSDHPECVDPTIGAFCRSWNDALPDADRTRLLRDLIPLTIGTRGTADLQDRRAFAAADWAVRTYTPAWLRLAGLTEHADTLASLAPLDTIEALEAATVGPIKGARQAAAAAWDAARTAAWDAARDAAWAAAGAAARAAARTAAWDAARTAAWDAAWAAAGAAAGDAAGAAARDAAWDADRAAARDDARDDARAALAALADTVTELQTSARDLLRTLCEMS